MSRAVLLQFRVVRTGPTVPGPTGSSFASGVRHCRTHVGPDLDLFLSAARPAANARGPVFTFPQRRRAQSREEEQQPPNPAVSQTSPSSVSLRLCQDAHQKFTPQISPFFFAIKAESGDGLSLAAATIMWRGGREGDTCGCHQAAMPQFWGTSAPFPTTPYAGSRVGAAAGGVPVYGGATKGCRGGVQRAWP